MNSYKNNKNINSNFDENEYNDTLDENPVFIFILTITSIIAISILRSN